MKENVRSCVNCSRAAMKCVTAAHRTAREQSRLKIEMKSSNSSSVCAVAGLFAVSSTFAQTNTPFAKANEEYAAGHFQEAIDGYETLARSGKWSASLFYDLGNAYFRASDFGRAILNYERALALEPRHPEADANLRIARDEAHALELV